MANSQLDALNKLASDSGATTTPQLADVQAMLGSILGVSLGLLVLALVVSLAQSILIYGPIVYTASENHLGRTATLGDAFAAIGKRLQTLAGGLVLMYVILIGFGLVMALALCLLGFGLGILFYAGLVLGSLLVPVLVLERGSVQTSLGRSWMLGKQRVWILLAISVGLSILTAMIDYGLTLALTQFFHNNTSVTAEILIAILGSFGSFLLVPLLPIAYTEVYYDARMRFEGLDIALSSVTTPNPSPADVQSPAPGPIIASSDYLNIALFAVGGFIIFILYFLFALSQVPHPAGL